MGLGWTWRGNQLQSADPSPRHLSMPGIYAQRKGRGLRSPPFALNLRFSVLVDGDARTFDRIAVVEEDSHSVLRAARAVVVRVHEPQHSRVAIEVHP